MRYLFLLLFIIPVGVFSQNKSIEIVLKNDSVIQTNWIYLKYNSILNKPYVKIHDKHGPKIKIHEISTYYGYDQNQNLHQFQNLSFANKRKFCFSEILFSNESTSNVEIFYNELTFGRNDYSIKKNRLRYKLNENCIKDLNYLNVRSDFRFLKITNSDFKKAQTIRIVQVVSAIGGTLLIGSVIKDNLIVSSSKPNNTKDKIRYVAGGLLLTLPFTLEKSKQKLLKNALKTILY